MALGSAHLQESFISHSSLVRSNDTLPSITGPQTQQHYMQQMTVILNLRASDVRCTDP